MEIWEPKPPGILLATPGMLRESFTFTFFYYVETYIQVTKRLIRVNFFITSVPTDFRRGVKEIFALLGFYAAQIG